MTRPFPMRCDRDAWAAARQHPTVQAYERLHNSAFQQLESAKQPPVDIAEDPYEYHRRPQTVRAVKWAGDNLEEVRKVYPGIGEEYMRDKGCGLGYYVISPYAGRVYFQNSEDFESSWIASAKRQRGK